MACNQGGPNGGAALRVDSHKSEQDLHLAEADHAEEVLDVVFPADHEPTKVMQPGEESFPSPASAIATQWTPVLRGRSPLSAMGCDHLNPVAFGQIVVQSVTVIGLVADQSCREGVEEAVPGDPFNELAFVRRSTFDTNGERKTVIIGESDDFRPFAAFGGPTARPPFFAPVKEASMKASSWSNFPRACNSSASTHKMRSSLPARTHCWKRRWQLWYGGVLVGQFTPLRSGAQHPQNSVEHRSRVLPRPTTTVGAGALVDRSLRFCSKNGKAWLYPRICDRLSP